MHRNRTTLAKFIIDEQRRVPAATGEFSGLLDDVATATKVVSHAVRRGALAGGDALPPIDAIVGVALERFTSWAGHLAAIAFASDAGVRVIPADSPGGKYLLLVDSLDLSGNLDVNTPVGTIFSILRARDGTRAARAEDFLQPGTAQVAAGFALYGPATTLLLTTGHGVDGFTLDHDIGEYILTHPRLTIPPATREFAIDASSERFWEAPVKRYIAECLLGASGPRGADFAMRWVASLAAESFRVLLRGGVVMYPVESKLPAADARLRLLFEANPVAFVVEQAGGAATTGRGRVLDTVPEDLHRTVPCLFGSRDEVERLERYHHEYASGSEPELLDSPLFRVRSLFRT